MSKLSWWDFGRLIGLMATGYRIDAIRILGENVMQDMGLVGLATDSIDVCTAEVRQVFQVLAESDNYPVMLHCTQGKDRTGLTILLALLLAEVETDAVNHDYMLSGPELLPERAERLKEIRSIGLDDAFADCNPELVSAVATHIEENYGSIGEYLDRCGVTASMQKSVQTILRADG
jgi:protein-tyrosine phosphatase